VKNLCDMILGKDVDRAMLAAYSLGELARPLHADGEDEPGSAGANELVLVSAGLGPLHEAHGSSGGTFCARLVHAGVRAWIQNGDDAVDYDARLKAIEESFIASGGAGDGPPADDTFESCRDASTGALYERLERHFRAIPGDLDLDSPGEGADPSAGMTASTLDAATASMPETSRNVVNMITEILMLRQDREATTTRSRELRDGDWALTECLRELDVNAKRQWVLEMLRWELGPVTPHGVPVPGFADRINLVCDRASPLEDLCMHCTPPRSTGGAGGFTAKPAGGVHIAFKDEAGQGAAVRREWMSIVSAAACDRNCLLFTSNDGGVTLHPNPMSGEVTPEHLSYFYALGRLAAVALYHGETMPLRLTPAFCSRLLGHAMTIDDLRSVDPTLHKNMVEYVREHGVRGLDLAWDDAKDPTGIFYPGERVPLRSDKDDAADKDKDEAVTEADAEAYLRALVARRVIGSVRDQTEAFAAGFGSVVPPPLQARMKAVLRGEDLSVLIAGAPAVCLEDWKRHSAYSEASLAAGFSVACFWAALRDLTERERVMVLQFATGLTSPPAGGFRNLVGYMGDAGAFYTLVPIRPRRRGERRSLRTLPGVSLRPSLAHNPRHRRLSTPSDAYELHPDVRSYGTTLSALHVGGAAAAAEGRAGGAAHGARVL
jgi:E3 ubiquitin-protein ligase HUWE1